VGRAPEGAFTPYLLDRDPGTVRHDGPIRFPGSCFYKGVVVSDLKHSITLEPGDVFGILVAGRVAKCSVNHVTVANDAPKPPKVNQCNVVWGNEPLTPDTNQTICQVGCLAISLFSQAVLWGCPYDLRTFLKVLYNAGAFSRAYLVDAQAAADAIDVLRWDPVMYGGFPHNPRKDWTVLPAPAEFLSDVLSRQPVIVQLDYDPSDRDIDSHFVLAYRYVPPTLPGDVDDDLLIMDPMGGVYRRASHYFNPDWLRDGSMPDGVTQVERIVTGARIWTRASGT